MEGEFSRLFEKKKTPYPGERETTQVIWVYRFCQNDKGFRDFIRLHPFGL